ncbi:MAG: iron-containing alcohol dehydrogenase, partial [Pseudomonadota bacterium]
MEIGPGGAKKLGEFVARAFGARAALIVTDAGVRGAGLLDAPLTALAEAGVAVEVFDQVVADPPENVILELAAIAARTDGLVIGFGGGSSMDAAKLAAVLATGEQPLSDMYGVDNVRARRRPLLLIPTTAGTGSEVTPISIVTTGETTKMGVVSPVLYADCALLDAELTLGLPPHVTASTGVDAMVHAIEAYTSKYKKNAISDALAVRALELLSDALPKAYTDGSDLEARQNALLGAMLAGQAFANAPV